MNRFKIIAFTHRQIDVDTIGKFHVSDDQLNFKLNALKSVLALEELMYLSTCNRVEFYLVTNKETDKQFLSDLLATFYPTVSESDLVVALESATVFEGEEAVRHLFNVASSLDSLVVGEREIITQVRNAFEQAREWQLSGDLIRIIVRKTIENAKEIFTQTAISKNPISVVSLAYRKLRSLNVPLDARIVVVGAGVTNTAMLRYLKKHGYKNFSVFNRTLENANKLAKEVGGSSYSLEDLKTYRKGFDVIVTCTGAAEPVITTDIYASLNKNDKNKKVIIDLAVPNDIDLALLNDYDINLIAVNNLREVAEENKKEREKELSGCEAIIEKNMLEFKKMLRERKVELAMSEVPKKVKAIKELALNEVFAKDLSELDVNSRQVLDKVLSYMEKKYNTVTMKMAKEIIIDEYEDDWVTEKK